MTQQRYKTGVADLGKALLPQRTNEIVVAPKPVRRQQHRTPTKTISTKNKDLQRTGIGEGRVVLFTAFIEGSRWVCSLGRLTLAARSSTRMPRLLRFKVEVLPVGVLR